MEDVFHIFIIPPEAPTDGRKIKASKLGGQIFLINFSASSPTLAGCGRAAGGEVAAGHGCRWRLARFRVSGVGVVGETTVSGGGAPSELGGTIAPMDGGRRRGRER